jgi:hypothetical protein
MGFLYAWSSAISAATTPRFWSNLPTAFTLGAFQQATCHQCTRHRQLMAEFWVGERRSACLDAWSTCLERLPYLEIWACHGPTQHMHAPLRVPWPLALLTARVKFYGRFQFVCWFSHTGAHLISLFYFLSNYFPFRFACICSPCLAPRGSPQSLTHPTLSVHSPTGQRHHLVHGFTTTCLFAPRGLWLMVRHGLDA